jgi:hypothetical protein
MPHAELARVCGENVGPPFAPIVGGIIARVLGGVIVCVGLA